MNKNIAMLILSVVLLAMILIVLNQWAFGPSSVPQNSADFSDILKKSSAVKVPQDAPGVRIPVGSSGVQDADADRAGADNGSAVSSASIPAGAAVSGSNVENPAGVAPADEGRAAQTAGTRVPATEHAPAAVQPMAPVAHSAVQQAGQSSVKSVPVPAVTPTPVPKVAEAKPAPATPPAKPVVSATPASPPAAGAASAKPGAVNSFESVTFTPVGSSGVLDIKATGKFGYKVFVLKQPQRVVVDLTGDFAKLTSPVVKANSIVTGVRIGRQEKGVRIVMDIAGTAVRNWNAEQPAGNRLKVTLK